MQNDNKKLSHTDDSGKAKMVDVSTKVLMHRVASACGSIILKTSSIELIRNNLVKKGDVLGIARIAGIQAAKMTPSIIPLCHPLLLTKVDVDAELSDDRVLVTSRVVCNGQTGVEMEALTAVSAALLTIYDMCKAVDKEMKITDIRLISKEKTAL